MQAFHHPLLVEGRYAIVAVLDARDPEPGPIIGYAVTDTTGAALRHECSFQDARRWLRLRIATDASPECSPPSRRRATSR